MIVFKRSLGDNQTRNLDPIGLESGLERIAIVIARNPIVPYERVR